MPPPKVVGLGEPTLPVAMPHVPKHPRRRLATQSTDAEDVAVVVLHHRLDPGVAQQTPYRLGVDHGTVLDLAPAGVALQAVQTSVADARGQVGFGISTDPGR